MKPGAETSNLGPSRLPRQRRWWETERGFGFLCVSPAVLVLLAVNIFPLLWLFYLSFTKYSSQGNKAPAPVGFKNFQSILESHQTQEALLTSLKFVGMGVLLQLALGLGIAVIVNHLRRTRSAVVTALVMPMMVSTAVAGMFWKFLLDANFGLVNEVLAGLKIIPNAQALNWFDKDHASWSVMIIDTWMWTPFVALIASAALSSVPKELYEAAAVDRVDSWTFFWKLCLPIIAPVLMVAGLLRTLDLLRLFDVPWIFNAGGPGISTTNTPIQLYLEGFRFTNTGKAAALAVIYLIIINIIAKGAVGRMMGPAKPSKIDWGSPLFQAIGALIVIAATWILLGPAVTTAGFAILAVAWGLCKLPPSTKAALASVASVGILVVALTPLVWILIASLKTRADIFHMGAFNPTFENFQHLWTGTGSLGAKPFIEQLGASLWIGLLATALSAGLGTLAAYAFSRYRFKGHGDLLFFILSTKMLPAVAVAIPVVVLYRIIGLSGSPIGLVILYTAMNLALATWIMKAFLDKVPREFEEAAVMERCTPGQAFRFAVLPLIKPAILTTALFCFLACWNEYAFALYLSPAQNLTAPPAITSVLGTGGVDWGYIAAGCMTLTIPALILTILARKTLILGVSFGVVDSK
jgi:multiple sugar transport system permease protein